MRKNTIPAVIAFAPALLLPLIQEVIRPRIPHAGPLGFVLSWAPDFVVGFCFPFSILIRPRAWTSPAAAKLFAVWSALTVVALLLDEYLSPFGPNVFDPADIAAGVGGVALALVVFQTFIRRLLTFREEDRPAYGRVNPAARRLPVEACAMAQDLGTGCSFTIEEMRGDDPRLRQLREIPEEAHKSSFHATIQLIPGLDGLEIENISFWNQFNLTTDDFNRLQSLGLKGNYG